MAQAQSGENWFLAGESAGFADPVLAAGMTMAHCAGREVAFTILELERGMLDAKWLKEHYDHRQSQRVWSHIRFADFWYTANAQFTDIKDCVQGIAKDAGLDLSPENAWRWLAQGGFIDEDLSVGVGGFSFFLVKGMGSFLADLPTESPLEQFNVFKLDLSGATYRAGAQYRAGHVVESQCYMREGKTLPVDGKFELIVNVLQRETSLDRIAESIKEAVMRCDPASRDRVFTATLEAFEAMIADGWVQTSIDPTRPRFKLHRQDRAVRLHKDTLHGAST